MKYVRRMGLLTSANYCAKTNEKTLSQTGASWAYNFFGKFGMIQDLAYCGVFTHDFHKITNSVDHGISAAGDGAVQRSSKVFNMSKQCAIWITQDPSHIPSMEKCWGCPSAKEHIFCLKTPFAFFVRQSPIQKRSCDEPQQWMCFTKPKRVGSYIYA